MIWIWRYAETANKLVRPGKVKFYSVCFLKDDQVSKAIIWAIEEEMR